MSDLVRVEIRDAEIERGLNDLARKFIDSTPAMRNISQVLANETEKNLEAQGRPRWAPLKNPPAHRVGGKIMQDSGRLAASMTPFFTSSTSGLGTIVEYAAIQHGGGVTRPHVILPKRKKALAFGGRVVKSVQHPGSRIPARPIIPVTASGELQPEAKTGVLDAVMQHLKG